MADREEIDPDVIALIQEKIETGSYESTSDVLRTALESLSAQEQYDEWLRQETQKGLDALDRGESFVVDDLDAYFASVKERAAKRRAAGIPISDAVKP